MRSVENKLLNIPLGSGMNESAGKRSAAPMIYAARNCRVRSAGALQKRCGTGVITGTTVVPSGTEHCLVNGGGVARPTEHASFIAALGDQIISGTTAGDAFKFNDDAGAQNFRGCFSSVLPVGVTAPISGGDLFNDVGQDTPASAATADGYRILAYANQQGFVRIAITGPDGATIYMTTVKLASATNAPLVKAVVVGSTFYVLYINSTAIDALPFTVANGAVTPGADTLVATGFATVSWDVSSYDGTNWFIVYRNAAGTFTIAKMAGTSIVASAVVASAQAGLSIWADPVNQRVWLGIADSAGDTKFAIYDSSLSVVVAPTVIDAAFAGGATPPLFGPCYSAVHPTSALGLLSQRRSSAAGSLLRTTYAFTVTAAGSVSSNPSSCKADSLLVISKPDAKQRAWCYTDALDDTGLSVSRYVLVRFPDAGIASSVVGLGRTVIEAVTPEFTNAGNSVPHSEYGFRAIAESSATMSMALNITVATATNASGAVEPTLQAQVFEYRDESHRQTIAGDGALLVAGQPTEFDVTSDKYLDASSGANEMGFVMRPEITFTGVAATGSGGTMPVGTYAYIAVVQWMDVLGRRQLSAPSRPVLVTVSTTTATQKAQIDVTHGGNMGQRSPTYGADFSGPSVLLYRTTNGGQNYQLLPLESPTAGSDSGSVVFYDATDDADLAENEFLYTDGGVLPNTLAPTCRFMCNAEDRLWCGGLWDSTILEASKIRIPGEPTNFTGDPTHQVVLPEACTGLAYMDGQVVAFAKAAIYLVGGDGPNDQGAGQFLPPRALVRGIGCVDYRSIVETPIGVFFQSNAGIYLIPRGFGSPQYVGNAVMDTITNKPTILSAAMTHTDEFSTARFLLADTAGGSYGNSALVFDLDSGQWFLDTYSANLSSLHGMSELGAGPDGALLMRYDLTSNADPIWAEDETTFFDAGAGTSYSGFITRHIELTWLYPFGPGGWGRVNKAVLSMTHDYPSGIDTVASDVSLQTETDDLTGANTQLASWSVAGSATSDASYRGFDVKVRDCTAIRVTIEDALSDPDPDRRGPKFTAVTLEIGDGGGIRMLTDSER